MRSLALSRDDFPVSVSAFGQASTSGKLAARVVKLADVIGLSTSVHEVLDALSFSLCLDIEYQPIIPATIENKEAL